MAACPDETVTVTSQADIDNGTLSSCQFVKILETRNATGTLNFSNLGVAEKIHVYDSPQLQALFFPNTRTVSSLQISQATSLTNVSLPQLENPEVIPYPNGFVNGYGNPIDLNITEHHYWRSLACTIRLTLGIYNSSELDLLNMLPVLRLATSLPPSPYRLTGAGNSIN
jgi:hypothetical protein